MLNWQPKVRFKELLKIVVDADIEIAPQEAHLNHYCQANIGRPLLVGMIILPM
jgi:hypothetical protein